MTRYLAMFAALSLTATAAPPVQPGIYHQQPSPHLQQINPLDFYLDNPEVHNYYNQAQEKQAHIPNGSPSRLETLEPDSEVELIPGAQPPQQPPQQHPVAPPIPGLLPGQRVFIVHMPVPGARPGTIGGYQPFYVVAASPQAHPGYPGNGYQNTVYINHSGQAGPQLGYPQQGVVLTPQSGPAYVLGSPLGLNQRPFGMAYQEPIVYQALPVQQGPNAAKGTIQLSQVVGLQTPAQAPSEDPKTYTNEGAPDKQQQLIETKEPLDEPKRSNRPNSHSSHRKP